MLLFILVLIPTVASVFYYVSFKDVKLTLQATALFFIGYCLLLGLIVVINKLMHLMLGGV